MATYNGAKFIREQLESLGRQTHPPYELIVSDDGSTDRTLEIVEDFRRISPFDIRVFRNPRQLGYGENFITASRASNGDYVAFCDQDDVWSPRKLEIAVRTLQECSADLYVHTATTIDENGTTTGHFTQGIRRWKVFSPMRLPPWGVFYGFSMVFRRDILDMIDPTFRGGHTFEFEGRLSHDLWVYFVAASLGRIVADSQSLAMYRRHTANQTPDVKGAWLQRLSRYLGTSANANLRRDLIAKHRSEVLLEFHRSQSGSRLHEFAKQSYEYWKHISEYESLRIRLFTQDRFMARALICAELLRDGGYRPWSRGGLGWRQLVKDILFGVFDIRRWNTRS